MLPENVDFGAEVLSNYSRNTFRIEPNSSTSATAGRVIQISLPENSVLDMKSLRMFMRVTTTKGVAAGSHDVLALLPANIPKAPSGTAFGMIFEPNKPPPATFIDVSKANFCISCGLNSPLKT